MSSAGEPKESLRDKIALIVVDKALIGVLLMMVGAIVSMSLDRAKSIYQTNDALAVELAKKRLEVIEAVLNKVNSCESRIYVFTVERALMGATRIEQEGRKAQAELDDRSLEELIREADAVNMSIDVNRFWLGEKLAIDIRNCFNSSVKEMVGFLDLPQSAKSEEGIGKLRERVEEIHSKCSLTVSRFEF